MISKIDSVLPMGYYWPIAMTNEELSVNGVIATKNTVDGQEEADYVPINIVERHGRDTPELLDRLHDLIEVRDALVELTERDEAIENLTSAAFEEVEWLIDLIERAESRHIVIPSAKIPAIYQANARVKEVEIGPVTYTSDMASTVPNALRKAVRNGFTMDLVQVTAGDWANAGLDGIAESSTGMKHIVDSEGKFYCGTGSPSNDKGVRSNLKLTEAEVGCETCRGRFDEFLRSDIQFSKGIVREIQRRANVTLENRVYA